MDLFINNQNIISVGKPLEQARELSQEEETLYYRGYGYEIINGSIQDISQTTEYIEKELVNAKLTKNTENETAKDIRYTQGFLFNNILFPCDFITQQHTTAQTLILLLNPEQQVISRTDFNKNMVDFSREEFGTFANALTYKVQCIEFRDGLIENQIKDAETLEELNAVIINYVDC